MGSSISSNSPEAFSLYKKSHFGEPSGEKIQYSLSEALFLVEEKKIEVIYKSRTLSFKDLMKKAYAKDKRIEIKYLVFRDLRKRSCAGTASQTRANNFRSIWTTFRPA